MSKATDENPWYYSIELEPGKFTDGFDFPNVWPTRSLMAKADVEGRDCLDLGCQEGLVSALLARRGARVTATDIKDSSDRIALVQKSLGVSFDYIPGLTLSSMKERLAGKVPFDLVVFSGVLYHVFDPVSALAHLRSVARSGGLVIVENMVTIEDGWTAHFNAKGRISGHNAYWFPTVRCFEYLLRFASLEPMDCAWIRLPWNPTKSKPPLARVAVACRAVDGPVAGGGDDWLELPRLRHFLEFGAWPSATQGVSELSYEGATGSDGTEAGFDVSGRVLNGVAPLEITDPDAQVRLTLDALV